ncbi:DUF2752 domain-containing protein [Streptomyces chumphonensis]|uniref:DUF2752 domain-containing protein n=1 Tax=Streptomyces chumphonensis TaxID=1214925 RepID=A0A927EV02_9ACTN|nr:DUF2752 domain-containing protein [Streptomyces chumphonensis]MBD3930189.1 DUF2752 domain-containing protein [Streptomyces chumphonensis]
MPRTALPAAGAVTARLLPLAALVAAGAGAAYVGRVDPNESGHYPPCPLLRHTGLFCPGCGGLRAVHALVTGDPLTALGANAAVVGGAAVLAVLWLGWFLRPAAPPLPAPGHVRWAAALAVAFTVVRNTPLGAALTPEAGGPPGVLSGM